jgi:hypothetical protein
MQPIRGMGSIHRPELSPTIHTGLRFLRAWDNVSASSCVQTRTLANGVGARYKGRTDKDFRAFRPGITNATPELKVVGSSPAGNGSHNL